MNGKTKVRLKDDVEIYQPLAEYKWKFGYIDGYCNVSSVPHAVVVTDCDEFEIVPIHCLIVDRD
jgi:hypothetical protein